MKKCQAITKGGTTCAANGAHIVMVWALNSVAYPQDKLPQLYANHGWVLQALNFCGAHRNILIGGKPVNISSTTPVEVNKPKEGIIMTNKVNNITGVYGCACNGTGIDPGFQAPCKCTQEVPKVNDITDRQAKLLDELTQEIGLIIRVDLTWSKVSTKKEAIEVIDLLKAIKSMATILRIKKGQGKVDSDEIEAIRAKINHKPSKDWVIATMKKLVKLDGVTPTLVSEITPRQLAYIMFLMDQLSEKLSDEQVSTIKEKLANEPTKEWADKAINKLLKIKSS